MISDAQVHALLEHFCAGLGTASSPAEIWIALSTTAPNSDGTNVTEPAVGAYARVQVQIADWAAAAARKKVLNVEKLFPQATASWGTPTHAVLYDASAAGNYLASGAIVAPGEVGVNVRPKTQIAPNGEFALSMPIAA